MKWELKFFAVYLSLVLIGSWVWLKVPPWIASHVHVGWLM